MPSQSSKHDHLIGQLLTNLQTIRCWDDWVWVDLPPNQLFIISEIEHEYEGGTALVFIQWGDKLLCTNLNFNLVQPAGPIPDDGVLGQPVLFHKRDG